jgi:zinc D-Ala-D-Ala dipeptidase
VVRLEHFSSLATIFSRFLLIGAFCNLFFGCERKNESEKIKKVPVTSVEDSIQARDTSRSTTIEKETAVVPLVRESDLERSIKEAGLVNVQDVDSTILVDLKYSTTDNFVKLDLYGDLVHCYLQKDIALKLKKAQSLLKERYPSYSLLIYDGVRPLRVQKQLWDTIDVPEKIKHFYVAHPDSGSIHNYGAAVDLTIADSLGKPLDMGTPFDYFGKLAYPIKELEMLNEGKLTVEQINNREILRNVMKDAGFTTITTEWWHFNGCSRARAQKKYKIVE